MALDNVGTDVPANFGDHRSNYSTICPAEPVLRIFMQYLVTLCIDALEAAGDIFSEGGIFFSFVGYNFRAEVDNDVISGVTVDNVAVDFRVKFGDSVPTVFGIFEQKELISCRTS